MPAALEFRQCWSTAVNCSQLQRLKCIGTRCRAEGAEAADDDVYEEDSEEEAAAAMSEEEEEESSDDEDVSDEEDERPVGRRTGRNAVPGAFLHALVMLYRSHAPGVFTSADVIR